MSCAPIPVNEIARVDALRQYAVLDTAQDQAFEDLTFLASQVCKTPVALVSLVDAGRQWFKSHRGLNTRETPRDVSFCAHAIVESGLFVVPDTTLDSRFAQNPMVTGAPSVKFYAGTPLVTPEGYVLGMLCVMDSVPRELSADQQATLEALGRLTMMQLELGRNAAQLVQVGTLLAQQLAARDASAMERRFDYEEELTA